MGKKVLVRISFEIPFETPPDLTKLNDLLLENALRMVSDLDEQVAEVNPSPANGAKPTATRPNVRVFAPWG